MDGPRENPRAPPVARSISRQAVETLARPFGQPNGPKVMLLVTSQPAEALALGETALAVHDKVLGRDHTWTKDSAGVTANAFDALGRAEQAKALRERYGLTDPEKPKAS
jgi:hypothetical protein